MLQKNIDCNNKKYLPQLLAVPLVCVDLVVRVAGLVACACSLLGVCCRQAGLLLPLLLWIPLELVKCAGVMVAYAAPVGLASPATLAMGGTNLLNLLTYGAWWYVAYSCRHQLKEEQHSV